MSSAFIPHRAATDPRYDDNLQSDDYYPAIRVSVWRERMRVDDTVSDARSHEILSTAVLLVNDELAVWREAQQTPLPDSKQHHYRRAVYQRAKAIELEWYRDVDTTAKGSERADGLERRIRTALQRSREALRLVLGKSRATIALI